MRATLQRQPWILVLLASGVGPVWAQDTKKAEDPASQAPVTKIIRGQVVDEAGKPVPGITLSTHWFRQEDQPVRAAGDVVKADSQGHFRVDLTFYYGRSYSLCALDVETERGGLAVVGPKTSDEPITIRVGPLVRVQGKYVCKELGTPVGWTNTLFLSMPERWQISSHMTKASEFSVLIPPGKYHLQGYGGPEVAQHRRDLTLSAGDRDVDLGAIDLAASELAKLKGKPAPALHPTDARGVSKGVQVADYRGKWVVLEFWGHWCGPCVARAIPRMMEIHDDHPGERDKYVVLTVHSALQGKSFTEVDEKLVPVVRDVWGGRMIPFPILLDADGKIQEAFGVSHWPTTILFDPEGKVVGEVQPDDLEKKLKPVPLAVALPRQLDREVLVNFDGTLAMALKYLKLTSRWEFELDREALKSLGLGEETKIPLTIAGRLSLRSALDLLLDPIGLTVKIGPKGYIITRKPAEGSSAATPPTAIQARCAARIERKLKESRSTYQFDRQPLVKVAAFFENLSGENVVLDPKGRLQGKIDPSTPVTASGKDVPLGEALEKLLSPIGLRAVVRDEVIVLEAASGPPVAAAASR